MKKEGVVVFAFLFILIFSVFFAAAANQTSDTSAKAYSCLEAKVAGKCSSLSSEEKIFSLLAINSCKSEVLSDSSASQCWPNSGGCKIKMTAQAILALNRVNTNTLDAEKWLLSQTANSEDLDWFLQVEATGNDTRCNVAYSGGSYPFTINGDKTLSSGAGTCLKVYNNYWMKISPSCYDVEFQISCENSFLTSLLYKKTTLSTIYVSQKTNSASGEGTTTEKVSSSCFREGSSCSYEGTLWAAMVLKYRKYDVSSYIPYLTAMADENSRYIPESFLQYLTNSFRTELLAKQASNGWWAASGDKFYDTAVALLPFQNEQLSEKTKSIAWLSEVQGTDGCWQGNIRNTAFLLYSIWPKKIANVSTAKDCESSSYHCMSSAACADATGTVLTDYTGCFTNVCCDKPQILQSCSQQNGHICSSDETCSRATVSSSDGSCCTGTCEQKQQQTSECEQQGGYCKSLCSDQEESSYYSCSSGNCCIQKSTSPVNILVIVILAILILLVLIGILFRKKLKMFLSKLKFGKGRGRPSTSGTPPFGRFPPSSAARPYPMQRRILPMQPRVPMMRPPQKRDSEFDDVVKKLRDIGKGETPARTPAKPAAKKEVNVRAHTRTINSTK